MPLNLELTNTKPLYAGISVNSHTVAIALNDNGHITVREIKIAKGKKVQIEIPKYLNEYCKKKKCKVIAAGLIGQINSDNPLASALWFKNDIVPFMLKHRGYAIKEEARIASLEAPKHFDDNHLPIIQTDKKSEVQVAQLMQLKDYKKITSTKEYDSLLSLVNRFKEERGSLLFINSTSHGGGVALMRHALIRLYRMLGCNVHWHVMSTDDLRVFDITKKKFHNVLQGVAPLDIELNDKDIQLYNKWIRKNFRLLRPAILKANVIVIDDPQPSGLIPLIKQLHPDVKIIYRSHIHIDASLIKKKHSQQLKTWNFVWDYIKNTDLFVSHPVSEFIPPQISKSKIVLMPATTDLLDGLNKQLTPAQTSYYLQQFNSILRKDNQEPLDKNRPYIIQIARFDPSKGILDVIEAYRNLRVNMEKRGIINQPIPQLVIAGHGAVDDPEGIPIFTETMHMLSMYRNRKYAPDIKVARLPRSDQILNALLSESHIALQLSYKEGFEVKVSEAIAKRKPVIAYKTGGIPLQIIDKKTGFLVETGDTYEVADHLYQLFTDKKLYKEMSKNCNTYLKSDFFTVANAYRWLYLADKLINKKRYLGNAKYLSFDN